MASKGKRDREIGKEEMEEPLQKKLKTEKEEEEVEEEGEIIIGKQMHDVFADFGTNVLGNEYGNNPVSSSRAAILCLGLAHILFPSTTKKKDLIYPGETKIHSHDKIVLLRPRR